MQYTTTPNSLYYNSLKPAVHSLTKCGRAPSGWALLITCPATHSSEHRPYPCDTTLACCHQYPIQLCDQVLADIWCQYHCISTVSSHQDNMLHSCLQLLLNYDLTDVMCASDTSLTVWISQILTSALVGGIMRRKENYVDILKHHQGICLFVNVSSKWTVTPHLFPKLWQKYLEDNWKSMCEQGGLQTSLGYSSSVGLEFQQLIFWSLWKAVDNILHKLNYLKEMLPNTKWM